jgi:cation diffusion facilitator CzcD-associated flavoprotein CzcO
MYDTLVLGAGQAGLAAGFFLKRAGLSFAVLEAAAVPTGSWPQYYESLRLFSPARYSSLPGYPLPWQSQPLSIARRSECLSPGVCRSFPVAHFLQPGSFAGGTSGIAFSGDDCHWRYLSGADNYRRDRAFSPTFSTLSSRSESVSRADSPCGGLSST